jgi:hypothetical protein
MQHTPGSGPVFLYIIFNAFSTASAPLLIRKVLKFFPEMEINLTAISRCSSL